MVTPNSQSIIFDRISEVIKWVNKLQSRSRGLSSFFSDDIKSWESVWSGWRIVSGFKGVSMFVGLVFEVSMGFAFSEGWNKFSLVSDW